MSAEFWAIIGVGVSLALLLYQFTGGLRSEVAGIRSDIADLRERMAHVEGVLEVMRDFLVGKRATSS
jgi:hypothetical protein